MARKTVSISRKPSAENITAVGGEPEVPTMARQLAMNLEPCAESAEEAPESAVTQSSGPFGLAIYGMVFCFSYGLVFSAIMLGKVIPGSGLISRGLHDGANAAQRSFGSKPERYEDSKTAGLSA